MTEKPTNPEQPNGDKINELESYLAEYLEQLDSGKRLDPIRILGDFKLIKKIGQGGMGAVYKAEQISYNRSVALKILTRTSSPARFKREIEAIGRLNHPGIVVLYEAGQQKDLHYFAQELVENGFTLADDLSKKKEKPDFPSGYFRRAAHLTAQVADALQHAHEANVIHRDLKPSNILLTPDGSPKVTDFGLAKVMDASSITLSGKNSGGTAYYMSPEQAEGRQRKIDKRTDIFSLGVTLYEMLTLKHPFVGETSVAVINQIITHDPEEVQKANPQAPRDLSVICRKAMEKATEKRYQTMKEFSEDLNRFLSGDVIKAKPAGLGVRFWKLLKRNPVVSTGLSVVMAFIVIVPWIMYMNESAMTRAVRENAIKLTLEKNKAYEAQKEADQQYRIAIEEKEKAQELEKIARIEEQKAIEAKNIADLRYEEIKRLSDMKILLDLKNAAAGLWPAYPENIDRLKGWITQAEELLGRLENHQKILAELRERVLPLDEDGKQRDKENHPKWKELQGLKNYKQSLIDHIRILEKEENSAGRSKNMMAKKKELAGVDNEIIELEKLVSERRTWKFENKVMEWRHQVLMDLVSGLSDLADMENGLLKDLKGRLDFAATVQKKSVGDYQKEWDETIASIANRKECPQYEGIKLKEQVGFAPIGRDPASGLWEFSHLQTGEIPSRDKDGKLCLKEGMGLVFVLIPGGSFNMGAMKPSDDHPLFSPNVAPQAEKRESPVHSVNLKPFFLSKYEMTQGQWLRVAGENPSLYKPGLQYGDKICSQLNPVEQVSWEHCTSLLWKLNLRLPSEAEWEYAARGGTTTVFWCGDEKESIRDKAAGNILDMSFIRYGGSPNWEYEDWLDDGYRVHAPIGCFSANPFGLHDVLGNVYEWCQDVWGNYINTPTDGSAYITDSADRVFRGGGWQCPSRLCYSGRRLWRGLSYRHNSLGLRPAFSLKLGKEKH